MATELLPGPAPSPLAVRFLNLSSIVFRRLHGAFNPGDGYDGGPSQEQQFKQQEQTSKEQSLKQQGESQAKEQAVKQAQEQTAKEQAAKLP